MLTLWTSSVIQVATISEDLYVDDQEAFFLSIYQSSCITDSTITLMIEEFDGPYKKTIFMLSLRQ